MHDGPLELAECWVIPGESGLFFEEKDKVEGELQCPARTAEIRWKDLSEEEKSLFREADQKEWLAILNSKAVGVIGPKEAQQVRDTGPDRIITSRMVRRWKPSEGPQAAPNYRGYSREKTTRIVCVTYHAMGRWPGEIMCWANA